MTKIEICLFLAILTPNVFCDYWSDRNTILANEEAQLLGSSIQLTDDEQKANDILMTLKLQEWDMGIVSPDRYLASRHFFEAKADIEQSGVFQFIQKIPKGASLHSHSSAMLSSEALMNLTYSDGLYGCVINDTFQLYFVYDNSTRDCVGRPLSEWRNEDPQFDDTLKANMSLVVLDPLSAYNDINAIWTKFETIFDLVGPLFHYRQFLHDYIYRVLQEFYDDNVRYLEIRSGAGQTFDSDGNIYAPDETLQLYLDTISEFRQQNPDFLGLRIIYANSRTVSNDVLADYIETYFQYKEKFPSLIAGFDLVGQEDLGKPLSDFADQLAAITNRTKFFFHAGETNWYGYTDLNLVDAVLLNTTRIGHAFGITKHPQILEIVKNQNIALEINPLSNQVLKLVDDLRNHVGAYLIANDFPVVITCDDPSFWGAKGLSYDWYMAFMAMTPRDADLRILKQLARNSFIYSSSDEEEIAAWLILLEGWWNDFIQDVIATYY